MPASSIVKLEQMPVATASALPPFSPAEIRKRASVLHEIMRGVMKEGTHYGTVPGTPKPSLWKAGAEVLCMTFRLAPMLESRVTADDPETEWAYTGRKRDGTTVAGTCVGFFEVESVCTIHSVAGEVLSRCSARCNNRETKYRSLPLYEIRNTILKMSEKRAFVSAVLMATGASDIFTQDIEEFPAVADGVGEAAQSGITLNSDPGIVPPQAGSALPAIKPKPQGRSVQGLTPKREAWLTRVAQESNVGHETVGRCLAYLKGASGADLKAFFDDLALRKQEAFRRFAA